MGTLIVNQYLSKLWTPAEMTTALWLDAVDSGTISTYLDGDGFTLRVNQWNDKSGSNNHAVSNGEDPIYTLDGINGIPAILFNQDMLKFANRLLTSSQFTIFGVFDANPQVNATLYSQHGGGANIGRTVIGFDSNGTFRLFFNNGTSYSLLSSNSRINGLPNLLGWSSDGAGNSYLHYNGIPDGSLLGVNWTPLDTFGRLNYLGDGFQATVSTGEFIIITTFLSVTDRQKTEGYLAHKWGLTANLPVTHPYKNTPPYV